MLINSDKFRTLALPLALAILLAACADSERPTPTGKAGFRGMNGITSAPNVTFRIEELGLETLPYKSASGSRQFDDFSYSINFDVTFPGDIDATRIATTQIDTVVDQDYLFVLTGQMAAPEIILWENVERIWDGTESVFQLDFGHVANSLGAVDIYFDVPGTAPTPGNEISSLEFGQISPPMDLENGDYEIVVTPKDDPANVIYSSNTITYAAGNTATITLFETDPSITSPLSVRVINISGTAIELADANSLPTERFLHGAFGTEAFDVSFDGDTANPIATNVGYGEITADFEVPADAIEYTYTATGNPGTILHTAPVTAVGVSRTTIMLNGAPGSLLASTLIDDRRPRATNARLRTMNLSLNFISVDIYLLDPGTEISDEENVPLLFNNAYTIPSPHVAVLAGSYEMWATVIGDPSMPLTGPIPIDVLTGENIELAILDNTDPAIVDIFIYNR